MRGAARGTHAIWMALECSRQEYVTPASRPAGEEPRSIPAIGGQFEDTIPPRGMLMDTVGE